jgi:hypothetical protein
MFYTLYFLLLAETSDLSAADLSVAIRGYSLLRQETGIDPVSDKNCQMSLQ